MATKSKTTATKSTTTSTNKSTDPVLHDVVRTEPGGIDPRLVEQRDAQREAEKDVVPASSGSPATLDPKLEEIREQTIAREKELAERPTTEAPARP